MRANNRIGNGLRILGCLGLLKHKPLGQAANTHPHQIFALNVIPAEVMLFVDNKRKIEGKLLPSVQLRFVGNFVCLSFRLDG